MCLLKSEQPSDQEVVANSEENSNVGKDYLWYSFGFPLDLPLLDSPDFCCPTAKWMERIDFDYGIGNVELKSKFLKATPMNLVQEGTLGPGVIPHVPEDSSMALVLTNMI